MQSTALINSLPLFSGIRISGREALTGLRLHAKQINLQFGKYSSRDLGPPRASGINISCISTERTQHNTTLHTTETVCTVLKIRIDYEQIKRYALRI